MDVRKSDEDERTIIQKELAVDVLYTQLAEEAAELSAAAAKMARKIEGSNPVASDLSVGFCRNKVENEFADVIVCAMQLDIPIDWSEVMYKQRRWLNRLGYSITSEK